MIEQDAQFQSLSLACFNNRLLKHWRRLPQLLSRNVGVCVTSRVVRYACGRLNLLAWYEKTRGIGASARWAHPLSCCKQDLWLITPLPQTDANFLGGASPGGEWIRQRPSMCLSPPCSPCPRPWSTLRGWFVFFLLDANSAYPKPGFIFGFN